MKKHSPSLKNFKPLILKNNLDFYQDTNIISFFSGVGRYFRVSNMLAKESVKSRMESQDGISFSEFSYQIFQAFDFYHLFSQENCAVQVQKFKLIILSFILITFFLFLKKKKKDWWK